MVARHFCSCVAYATFSESCFLLLADVSSTLLLGNILPQISVNVAKRPTRIGRNYPMANTPAILAEGLYKSYGKTHALDGVDLVAEEGTVLGVLGPNGAGKTTTVRILTTLT